MGMVPLHAIEFGGERASAPGNRDDRRIHFRDGHQFQEDMGSCDGASLRVARRVGAGQHFGDS
jgi:hypothetical protein